MKREQRRERFRALGLLLVLSAVGMSLVSCSGGGPAASLQETAQPRIQPTRDPQAPPFPASLTTLPFTPEQCAGPRPSDHADIYAQPGTVAQLAQRSTAVVLVTAEYQGAYWKSNGTPLLEPTPFVGSATPPQMLPSEAGVSPATATDFEVLKVYKGQLPTRIQGRQVGSLPNTLPQCDSAGFESINNPLPRAGVTYVLFLDNSTENSTVWGPTNVDRRLEVRAGDRVFSAQHQSPSGPSSVDVNGLPLAEVVRQITG